MEEISELDAAKMVTFIYGINLPDVIDKVQKNHNGTCTVGDAVADIKQGIEKNPQYITGEGESAGAEMSVEEYKEVLDQIEGSETLMDMEIENFVNEEDTDFRAFTLVDPNGEVKPLIVFRGTAGDYQWADNFSGLFSSRTPAQMRAQQYVVNSGHDHVTVAGHSKGGNMAAVVVYMLPEGMVDKAYSFDGQGVSDAFLDYISESQKENALNRIHNINEYRDIVSLLLTQTGRISNTKYIDSGVLFDETVYAMADLAKNLKMSIFHAHKPNYFLLPEAYERETRYHPNGVYDLPGGFSNTAAKFSWWRGGMLFIAKGIAEALYTTDSHTDWSEDMWNAVFDAEKVYDRIRCRRIVKIREFLEKITGVDMMEKLFIQPEGSLVVEGAVLTCQYCNGIGCLEITEERADLIQGKRVAVKTDNKKENIQMDSLKCSRIDWTVGKALPRDCEPDIWFEWLLTDPDKLRGPRGEEAVLKKSVLGCMRGGMIEIVHNGQMEGPDAGKVIKASKREKSEATKEGEMRDLEKQIKQMSEGRNEETEDSFTSPIAIGKWLLKRGEAILGGISEKVDELNKSATEFYENWIDHLIEQQINQFLNQF